MAKLNFQKRIAADILKVGKSHIWLDPDKEKQKELQAAITRADVRRLINRKLIKVLPGRLARGRGVKEKKRRRKRGSRSGSKYARLPRKKRWMFTVRALRSMLKEMKSEGQVDNPTYRKVYMLVKGGQFRSRSHMQIYMEQHGMIKKKK